MSIWKWFSLAFVIIIVGLSFVLFERDIPTADVDAKYSNDASRFLVTSDGARIHYRDEGHGAGVPIVLLHGAMASLHTWEPWVRALATKYRVITLDLPSHGLTGQIPKLSDETDPFNHAINAVVDELDITDFVLGGNSMGGGATWRYALSNPERVKAMILIASVAPIDRTQSQEAQTDRGAIGFTLLRQSWFRTIARYIDPSLLVGQGLRSAYNNSPVVDQKLIDRYSELILRKGTREAILNRAQSNRDPENLPDLSVLNQPTLIMWGAKDTIIPVAVAEWLENTLPNTQTIIYPDLGHVPMEEDPLRTSTDARHFLEGLN